MDFTVIVIHVPVSMPGTSNAKSQFVCVFLNVNTPKERFYCNFIKSNYSPEVETDKPFKRKRKGNDLDGKVLCVF